jgi:hypothetical protein
MDEERYVPSSFKERLGDYSITLELTHHSKSLEIEASNVITLEKYSQVIDGDYIKQDQQLECFKNPTDIF